ncbi:hypothetical protein A9Q78_01050 [Methylophaga sp. 41_12_T18]|nr:hypothetical protein A9Q78_01050 [Methylophaga sp. 41_12_T18]
MKRSKLMTIILVLSCCSVGNAHADWGSLIDDWSTKGKALLADESTTSAVSSLDIDTIISGLKEALAVGSRAAVDNVSQTDGYLSNELIHIAMPAELQQAGDLMRQFGLGAQADQFENSLNKAAEKAAPQATNIIVNAIKNMSIEDANKILNGADDAATQYFKENTSTQLTELFTPTVTDSLNEVGSTKYYNDLTAQVAAIPLVGENINLDLPSYVTEQALDGLFTMIALEEKKIRDNPAARTTELLQKVFSN